MRAFVRLECVFKLHGTRVSNAHFKDAFVKVFLENRGTGVFDRSGTKKVFPYP